MNMRLTVEMIRGWGPCYDPVTMLDDEGKKAEIDFPGLSEDWTGPLSEILNMSEIPIADRVWVATHALPPKEARLFACWCALRAANRDKAKTHPASLRAIRVAILYAHGEATADELAAARRAVSVNAACDADRAARVAAAANARNAAWDAALHAALHAALPGAERKAQLARLKKITKILEAAE